MATEIGRTRRQVASGSSTRREELLTIAARQFASRGYSQTTVRDIADAAGILSGSLYHHFSSKEAMLREILDDFVSGILRRFTDIAAAGDPPRETLAGLVRASFRVIDEHRDAVTLYQYEYAMVAALPGFEFLAPLRRSIEKVWTDVLEAGQRAGQFRDDLDPVITYFAIRDSVWTSVRWYQPDGDLGPGALADRYLELFLSGLATTR